MACKEARSRTGEAVGVAAVVRRWGLPRLWCGGGGGVRRGNGALDAARGAVVVAGWCGCAVANVAVVVAAAAVVTVG